MKKLPPGLNLRETLEFFSRQPELQTDREAQALYAQIVRLLDQNPLQGFEAHWPRTTWRRQVRPEQPGSPWTAILESWDST